MLKYNILKSKIYRPAFIFTILAVLIYIGLLVWDLAHETASSTESILRNTLTGNVFLSVSLSLFITTILKASLASLRKNLIPWLAASGMCLLLIFFSFFAFYNGKRIVTEADGPASIGYLCVWSELSDSVDSLTSSFSNSEPDVRNNNLCILKNMPLAASNYGSWSANQDLWDDTVLVVFGSLILGTYFSPRLLNRKNTR